MSHEIPNEDNKTVITEPFYTNKFMVIQQSNVVLWRKLVKIRDNEQLSSQVKGEFGDGFFDDIDENLI